MAVELRRVILGSDSLADLEPSRKIDTRGQVCPYPSFEAAKLAQSAGPEEVIEIILDDKYAALNSIPTVLRLRNFEYGVLEGEEGVFLVKARRVR